MQQIDHAYIPRQQFLAFHQRSERFAVLVCHRRAGKTVAVIADMVVRAMRTKKKNAFYAYYAPFAAQAKDVAWKYFVEQTQNIPGVKIIAGEITLPNQATIKVMGADNMEAKRGLFYDGVVLDEFGSMGTAVWSEVVRPAMMDRQGWVVFIGTPRGKNKFWEIVERAQGRKPDGKPVAADQPPWFYLRLISSESGILNPKEIEDTRQDLDENEFLQEMECSFEATIRGAYYGDHITKLANRTPPQIRDVKHDPRYEVNLAMDIGFADATAIWFWQTINGEVRFIDYWEETGKDAEEVVAILSRKYFDYGTWWLPHDAKAKTFRSKKSVLDTLREMDAPARIVPDLALKDGIDAVRKTLRTYPIVFDGMNCARGISALQNYSRKFDVERKVYSNVPKHDQFSHGADAFRYACLVINHDTIQASIEEAQRRHAEAAKGLNSDRTSYTFNEAFADRERQLAAQRDAGPRRI